MLFCVDLFFYQIISQFLLGSPICLPYRHKCYFWLIGPELSIVKYFPAIFSLICIELSEISPKLIKFVLLKMIHNSHTSTFHRFPDMEEKNQKFKQHFSMAFHPVTLQPPLYRHLSFFLPPIQTPSKWKSWFTRRLHYGLKLLAQYEYILISCTFVQIFWNLACMTTSIGTAFLHSRTFNISFTAFNTGSCKTTGFLRCWAVPLLHRQDVLKEFTAS